MSLLSNGFHVCCVPCRNLNRFLFMRMSCVLKNSLKEKFLKKSQKIIEFSSFQTASRYDGPSVPRMSGHQIHEPFDEVARECVRSLPVSFFEYYSKRNILRVLHRFFFFVLCFFFDLKDSLDDGFIKYLRNFCNFIYYLLICLLLYINFLIFFIIFTII